ncbi:hypothetical protein F4225_02860, partial [Candidatus Poribacteria bacterium]|nr:hypothetical protein [Candidatus Poribacteria bacterium]
MYFLAGQKGSIYREKDEVSLVKFGNFKIIRVEIKQEVSESRILGNDWVSRTPGNSKTYIAVEVSVNATIGIGDKVFFRSCPTVGDESFYQWWGTFTEVIPVTYGSNTFTGQIT